MRLNAQILDRASDEFLIAAFEPVRGKSVLDNVCEASRTASLPRIFSPRQAMAEFGLRWAAMLRFSSRDDLLVFVSQCQLDDDSTIKKQLFFSNYGRN
jgi:hypothetical protein